MRCIVRHGIDMRHTARNRCARIHFDRRFGVRRSALVVRRSIETRRLRAASMQCVRIHDRTLRNRVDGRRADNELQRSDSSSSSYILRNRPLASSHAPPDASVAVPHRATARAPRQSNGPSLRLAERVDASRSLAPCPVHYDRSRPPHVRRPPAAPPRCKFSQLRRTAHRAYVARRSAHRQTNESGTSRHVLNPRADCSPGCGYVSPNDEVNDETQQ